jgi:phosphoserine phosphatase RsbU/P
MGSKDAVEQKLRRQQSRRIRDLKLSALLDITKSINSNSSTEQLFRIYEDILKNQLSIGKVALYSNNDGWRVAMNYGIKPGELNFDVEKDLVPIKDITEVTTSSDPKFNSFDSIIPVYHKNNPLAYVLIADISQDSLEVSTIVKHLPFIQTLTNIIVVAIENKRLAKENIRQEGVKKELELAREMQRLLFPAELPDNGDLQVAAFYQPHHQVGGDYYDFIRVNENESIFCMADVSGKGVSAAILMANFQANLRALVNHTTSLSELIKELNTKVISNAKGEKFITFFIARYNTQTRIMTYINAAHNPPLMLSEGTVSLLNTGCTGLGMFEEIPTIREGVLHISPETTLVCYTDGLIELENDTGESFELDNLIDIVKRNKVKSMQHLNELIIKEASNFRENQPYIDDIALLSVFVR